jgi:predicted transcriptional regulator
MLVEIPDPEVILGIIAAFLVGLFVLFISYKIKSLLNRREKPDSSYLERFDFYERQLIDMKIRLDSLDIDDHGSKLPSSYELKQFNEKLPEMEDEGLQIERRQTTHSRKARHIDNHNTTDYVLGLITNKVMTSRDIQNASHRSREHTARLMNKLFKDGFVERNTKTKPYSYSITDKGLARLNQTKNLPETLA